jgi:opacity protein-like surface antigen
MLRKILLVLATTALFVAPAAAQIIPSFGVKGGLNFSSVDVDDLDASTRTGYAAGLFTNLTLPGLSLQGEVLYTVKGFSEGQPRSVSDTEFDYREHFIEVPVLLKWSLPLPAVSPSLYAGPAVSFPVKSEADYGEGWQDIDEDPETAVWSICFGADVTLMDRLMLDVRYDWGLSAIRKTDFGQLDDLDEDIKDRTFSVMVGYKF